MTSAATGAETPIRVMLTSDAIGGVWNYTLSMAEGLVEAGCFCSIVLLGPAATPAQRQETASLGIKLVETGFELDWLSRNPAQLQATSRKVAELAQQLEADVAHVHSPVFASSDFKIPIAAVAHSCSATWWHAVLGENLPERDVWRWQAMQSGLAAASAVISPTHAFAAALEHAYGRIASLRVIYNGVRPSSPPRRRGAERGYVISAGRLWDAGKNMRILDEAAGLQPYPVILAGAVCGPDGSAFLGRHATTPGVLSAEAMRQAYGEADLFVSPSLYEPFGLAVLEAASAGTPLLLADIPTFRELWQDAAVFVPPRDPVAWAQAISSLLASRDRITQLGQAAWQRSLRYQQQDMVDQTLALHRDVLAGHLLEGVYP